jgi:glycosyltransferase involved in cell wall biosynthesis
MSETAKKDNQGAGLEIAFVSLSIQTSHGGPARSVVGLAEGVARQGARVSITACDFGPSFGMPVPVDEALVRVRTCPVRSIRWLRVYFPLGWKAVLRDVLRTAKVMHMNGVFVMPMQATATRMARRLGIPQIVSVRGMLHPEALRVSVWKKFIARKLYGDWAFRSIECIHALTPREAEYVRQFGLTKPVAVIPNGIRIEEFDDLPAPDEFRQRWPGIKQPHLLAYLGRIHPIKGLPNLLAAWANQSRRLPDWHLVIAGPDEVGQKAALEDQVRQGGIQDRVSFVGPMYDRDKLQLLSAAKGFVLASLSEGFSMSVLEAMACRLPVLITTGCNFEEVASADAGVVVEPNPPALGEGLSRLLSQSSGDREAMGRRGRELVERKYSWPAVAGQMLSVYRWLALGADRPECVVS